MPGSINDRAFYEEYNDKPTRLMGASWFEFQGANYIWDDFQGPTGVALTTTYGAGWTNTDTAGGGSNNVPFGTNTAAGAPVAAAGGWIRGTCSDNAAGVTETGGGIIWRPDRCGNGMLVFETRVNLPSITAINVCVGMFNAITAGNGLALNNNTTTTITRTTMTNGFGFLFDSRGTGPIWFGTSIDNSTLTNSSTANAANGTASTPAAGKSYVLRIECDSLGNTFFYQGAEDLPSSTPLATTNTRQATAGSTLKSTLLCPYLGADNAAGAAAKSLDVDYVLVACAR